MSFYGNQNPISSIIICEFPSLIFKKVERFNEKHRGADEAGAYINTIAWNRHLKKQH
jgi:hypothetical protein